MSNTRHIIFLNTSILALSLFAVILSACSPAPAPDATLASLPDGGLVYGDPAGRFSLPLVGDWTPVETDGSYGRFTLADPALDLYVATAESDDLEVGVNSALAQIGVDALTLSLLSTEKDMLFIGWTIIPGRRADFCRCRGPRFQAQGPDPFWDWPGGARSRDQFDQRPTACRRLVGNACQISHVPGDLSGAHGERVAPDDALWQRYAGPHHHLVCADPKNQADKRPRPDDRRFGSAHRCHRRLCLCHARGELFGCLDRAMRLVRRGVLVLFHA